MSATVATVRCRLRRRVSAWRLVTTNCVWSGVGTRLFAVSAPTSHPSAALRSLPRSRRLASPIALQPLFGAHEQARVIAQPADVQVHRGDERIDLRVEVVGLAKLEPVQLRDR